MNCQRPVDQWYYSILNSSNCSANVRRPNNLYRPNNSSTYIDNDKKELTFATRSLITLNYPVWSFFILEHWMHTLILMAVISILSFCSISFSRCAWDMRILVKICIIFRKILQRFRNFLILKKKKMIGLLWEFRWNPFESSGLPSECQCLNTASEHTLIKKGILLWRSSKTAAVIGHSGFYFDE